MSAARAHLGGFPQGMFDEPCAPTEPLGVGAGVGCSDGELGPRACLKKTTGRFTLCCLGLNQLGITQG